MKTLPWLVVVLLLVVVVVPSVSAAPAATNPLALPDLVADGVSACWRPALGGIRVIVSAGVQNIGLGVAPAHQTYFWASYVWPLTGQRLFAYGEKFNVPELVPGQRVQLLTDRVITSPGYTWELIETMQFYARPNYIPSIGRVIPDGNWENDGGVVLSIGPCGFGFPEDLVSSQ
jgi:hypothetical protein